MGTLLSGTGGQGPDQPYSVRFALPDLLVRGLTNTVRATVIRSGAVVAPTLATVTVYDANNNAQVGPVSATITNGYTSYAIQASDLPATLSLGLGWRVEWNLVIGTAEQPDAILQPRNDAALVRTRIHPVITDEDLQQRLRGMDHNVRAAITSGTSQEAIDEAWLEINHRLINQGNRPNLVVSPSAFRMPHLFLALSIRLRGLGPAFREDALDYERKYEKAWDEMTLVYDEDDDGQADHDEDRIASSQPVWLS